MADPFFDARNALSVGNYHQAVADASGAKTNHRKGDDLAAFNLEKEVLISLSQIGLGQNDAVISQLASETHPMLKAVKNWAEFSSAIKNHSPDVTPSPSLNSLLERLTAAAEDVNPAQIQIAVLAVSAFLASGNNGGAIKLAKKWLGELPAVQGPSAVRQHIELRALIVEALLRMRRPEMARSEVKLMEQLDDESVLTVLYSGIVSLHEGLKSNDEYKVALQRFREISLRSGPSVLAYNLMAIAHMELGDFVSAERSLLDALAMRSADVDTTANLAVVSAYLGKAADPTNRYITQAISLPGTWSNHFATMKGRLDDAVEEFRANA